ncbi:MAG: NAD+ synthase [Deltaproteobacteria bacterium]|nr:NAD+ synthase [Deltaproteobacteria bacterium]
MKISINQINPIIGDFEHNLSLVSEAVRKASLSGCDLAVFPELTLMGYPPKDLLEKPAFIKRNLEYLEKISKESLSIGIICGFVDINKSEKGKPLINGVAFLQNGKIIYTGGKKLLPSYDVFDETRYFEPAEHSLYFVLNGIRIGVTICEDIWNVGDIENLHRYSVDPVEELAQKGIDILINISASPYTIKKPSLRMKVLEKIASKYGLPIIYCNQVGGNDDLVFDGSSMVVDKTGRPVLRGNEFHADTLMWESDADYQSLPAPWTEEEKSIINCLTLGTRDYVTKCGFKKVLVGLSGGLDSSLVAYIAMKALGPENVTGISMPSPYTSELSKKCAKVLAKNLGIHFDEIPIADIFDSYKTALSPAFKGLKENETEENLQARIRGSLLMAMSNKFNALLLTTGNKSETATGYCTLYGDMCGALAVISDVPKTICYRVAAFINREKEIIPQEIIDRPPSAELRPNQTDQDSLPPYDMLDQLIEAIVEKNLSFEEIIEQGYDPAITKDTFRRIVINEYKRRQASPGLKVTSKAFGYGRRYPIARRGEFF